MTTVIGISGSLRSGSFNTALLRTATMLMPEGARLEIAAIKEIPLYNGDVEAEQGLPEAVATVKEQIVAADGLLLATPEYNNSMPGVLKNAIDWLTRPPSDIPRVFGDRPVAIMGATPGGMGTALAQSAWLPVLRTLRTRPWFGGRLVISRANSIFNKEGEIVDDDVRNQLQRFMRGFVEFISTKPADRDR